MVKFNLKKKIVEKIISLLLNRFGDNVISIYGIGSFFTYPEIDEWNNYDIDIIVIVRTIESIPQQDWTEIRYEMVKIEDFNIWFDFNSLEGIKNKEQFTQESFANYEWSIIDLKYKENSQLLYGEDIRDFLPDLPSLKIDYNDIFARSLYHLNKSFASAKNKEQLLKVKIELTKAIFKFGFYFCILHDPQFHFTSITEVFIKLQHLKLKNLDLQILQTLFQEAIYFRKNNQFITNFKSVQINLTFLILTLIKTDKLHVTLTYDQFIIYLEERFNGLYNIIHFLKKAKNLYYSEKT